MDSQLVQFSICHSLTMMSNCWLMRQVSIMCRVPGLFAHTIHHHNIRQRLDMTASVRLLLIASIMATGGTIAADHLNRLPDVEVTIGTIAIAQTIAQTPEPPSAQEVRNYASAILAMEPLRQTAYTEVKRIVGSGNVPEITCHRRQGLDSLAPDIRIIAIDFCTQSKRIVEGSGLSISRFNDITLLLENDQTLQQRIQAELIRLQNQQPTPK